MLWSGGLKKPLTISTDSARGYRASRLPHRGAHRQGQHGRRLPRRPRARRRVALKLIAPELAGDDRFRERFLQESELAASLDHPNIVPIYHAGRDRRTAVHRPALRRGHRPQRSCTAERHRSSRRACWRSRPSSRTRSTPPTRGLVHRDVKPSNVLPRARPAEHSTSPISGSRRAPPTTSLTRTGQIVGTVGYPPPSRSRTSTSTAAPTSTRSAVCSTSA